MLVRVAAGAQSAALLETSTAATFNVVIIKPFCLHTIAKSRGSVSTASMMGGDGCLLGVTGVVYMAGVFALMGSGLTLPGRCRRRCPQAR